MDKADRYNAGKRRWSLVHYKSLEPLVEALEYGANKYAPDNWKKGLDKKEILDSTMRHISAVIDGEDLDPESKVKHIGHAMANLMFYEYFDNKKEETKEAPPYAHFMNDKELPNIIKNYGYNYHKVFSVGSLQSYTRGEKI